MLGFGVRSGATQSKCCISPPDPIYIGGNKMADITLDVCGEVCPMPVVKTKETLKGMKAGQTLEVTVDYPPSRENVQRFALSTGNEVVEVKEEGALARILIKKG
jgi:tRNA 2-thiouridine synthesizing protein A